MQALLFLRIIIIIIIIILIIILIIVVRIQIKTFVCLFTHFIYNFYFHNSILKGSVEAQCGLVLNSQGGVIRRGNYFLFTTDS